MEESPELANVLSETETTIDTNELASVDDLVIQMLMDIESDHINNDLPVDLYKQLQVV